MKKLAITILMGSALFASEEAIIEESPVFESHKDEKNHELTPNFRWFKHSESDYTFSKYLAGIEYNYKRSEGINFNSFVAYSFYKDKSYFVAEWGLKYLSGMGLSGDSLRFYPVIGMSNTSHFSINSEKETFQIYRSEVTGGLGLVYNILESMQLETNVSYFKDLATACILHKDDEFWGKNYYSPSGFKINLSCRVLSLFSKDLELGGFYAKTFKKCYYEFGFKTSLAFAF